MDIKLQYKMVKNKSGLSMVVSTLLLILLAVVMISIIWGVVNTLVDDEVNESESCFNIYDTRILSKIF